MIDCLHLDLTDSLNKLIKSPENSPEWIAQGTTYLLPKSENTKEPRNYRPITCLATMYKLLTSIISERTYNFLEDQQLLSTEQKGCRRGSYGCKDQLLVNKMILEDCKKKRKTLSVAWIDYKKVFDSVPHTWIIKCMEIFKLSPMLIQFIRVSMEQWKTVMILNAPNPITTNAIKINSGIFQGDSFSPLIFCLALAPLSFILNKTKKCYTLYGEKINHLFYMDDLKLYAQNNDGLNELIHKVKQFSDDIKMEFGLDKCAKASFVRGLLQRSSRIQLNDDAIIRDLENEKVYKYLGVDESDGIQHSKMKEKIRKEYYRRIRLILKSELNSANKMGAINTLAVPVVTYSFNIINWTIADIHRLDRKTRKLLTIHRMHHPKADVHRIYLPRKEGGRGLIQILAAYKTSTIGLEVYLREKEDRFIKAVYKHEKYKGIHSIVKAAERFAKELKAPQGQEKQSEPTTKKVKRIKQHVKNDLQKQLKETWKNKVMHGKYPESLEKADVDRDQTNIWLKSSGLKPETEGLIIAAQDQCLPTRSYRFRIIKDGTNPMCRLCGKFEKTIEHITAGCHTLAVKEYIHRHNRVAAYVHYKILQHYNIQVGDNWYQHEPKTVTTTKEVTVLWDMPISTDRELKANRPDIVVKDHQSKTCYIIDISTPSERNMALKEVEKLSKYKDLEIEINRMWNMKTIVIPVVIGNLGMIRKTNDKWIKQLPGTPHIEMLQKITLLGTAHILRKVLSIKTV